MTQIDEVADTAFLTAYARALETERDGALFRDPLAATLLSERGRELGQHVFSAAMEWSIVVRTVLIDEMIASAVAGGVTLVVNLGAGLDTRPYRMELPPTLRWLEVDQSSIILHKSQRLAEESPRCQLDRIAADLSDPPSRRELFASFMPNPAEAVLVVTEGVVPYWPNETVAAFAEDLHRVGALRGWIVDHIPPHVLAARRKLAVNSEAAPLLFEPADWRGFFTQHGFRVATLRNLFDEGLRVGRPMPLPPGAAVVSGDANARAQAFPGYALLEPSR
ncbi:MAG: SAM-dependent methyltransferase [Polyangiaceae bacterium]